MKKMNLSSQAKLSTSELASFCNQTSLLIQAGIPPADSMGILLQDTKASSGQEVIRKVFEVCRQGEPFHVALKSSGYFPDYLLHMISLGEESGNLDNVLFSLATYYEKEETISDSIKNAVTYPFIMIGMMLIVIFVLVSKVLPIFQQVFIELGSEISGVAGTLLSMSNSLNRYSLVFLIVLCVVVAVCLLASRTASGRQQSLKLFQSFPLTKGFYEQVACQRFASGMALTLSSGMDTYASLQMVSQLVGNEKMQKKIEACRLAIQEGSSFADALSDAGIFNHLHSRMVAIGFRSGNIDVVLSKIADRYERETDQKIHSIISVLEPTLVIILSVIVGLILLSVILPLMGIMTSIG